MRQVLQMLVDVAHELHRESISDPAELNKRMRLISEAYEVLDRQLSRPGSLPSMQVQEAMTTADFAGYFGQTVSRAFYTEYPLRTGAWRDWTTADEVPDFRNVERSRMGEFGTLLPRRELGEAKQAPILPEKQVLYHVEEYARAFSISWRVLVNDDMGEVRRFPGKMLRAATRFEAAFVNALYDNPTTHAALVALGPMYSQPLELSIAGISAAYQGFLGRRDQYGNMIQITPKYLVTSPTKELEVTDILAGYDPNAANPRPRTNAATSRLEWRPDPYISDQDSWYLFADPNDVPAVTVARLRGYTTPQVYLRAPDLVPFNNGNLGAPSWTTGNFAHGEIEFMVNDIIGGWDDSSYVGVTDYQGVFYSPGPV